MLCIQNVFCVKLETVLTTSNVDAQTRKHAKNTQTRKHANTQHAKYEAQNLTFWRANTQILTRKHANIDEQHDVKLETVLTVYESICISP